MNQNDIPILEQKVREIAEHLEGWNVKQCDIRQVESVLINNAHPGAEMYFNLGWGSNSKRMTVAGSYPRHYAPLYEDQPRITVSLERDPVTIAKDIKRRFIGRYLELLDRYQKIEANYALFREQKNAALDELACTARATNISLYTENSDGNFYASKGELSLNGTVTNHGNGILANLNLRWIPMDLAKEICRLYAEYQVVLPQK